MKSFKTNNVVYNKNRSSNIEILRFILCIFVVIIHVHGIFDYSLSLTYSAVTIFAIISGFFLFERNDSYLGFKFILTIVFLLVLNIVIFFITRSITGTLDSVDWTKRILFGSAQFWYLWAMLLTLFISPLLFLGVKHLGKWASLVIIIVLYLVVQLSQFDYIYVVDSYTYSNPFILFFSLMFGAWIKKYLANWFLTNKKLVLIICLPILIFVIFIQVLASYLLLNVLDKNETHKFLTTISKLSVSNERPLTIVVAFCLFSLFYIWEIKYNRFFNYLGSMSIIVYAVHYAILYWLKESFVPDWNLNYKIRDLAILLITLSSSIAIAAVFAPIFKIYQKFVRRISKYIGEEIKNRFLKKGSE